MSVVTTVVVVVLILGFVIFIHELGHFVAARLFGIKVEEFGMGYPPRIFAFRRGGTNYSLNLIPLGGFCKLLGEEDPSDPQSFAAKSAPVRLLVLAAGSLVMFLAPFFVFPVAHMIPHEVVIDGSGVQVFGIVQDSPAMESDIEIGDVILAVDGTEIGSSEELRDIIDSRVGTDVAITISRNDEILTVSLVPRVEYPSGQGPIGVSLGWATYVTEKKIYAPWDAIPMGLEDGWMMYVLIGDGIKTLIDGSQTFAVTGIVGIAQATGDVVKAGFLSVVGWTCLLSINLAVVNLLPIPALDGGRIVFVLIEVARKGKRVSPRTEGLIHLIGFVLLIGLMLIVTYYDILRVASGERLLQ